MLDFFIFEFTQLAPQTIYVAWFILQTEPLFFQGTEPGYWTIAATQTKNSLNHNSVTEQSTKLGYKRRPRVDLKRKI